MKFLKKKASGHQTILLANQTEVDAKLNLYNFEKLHLQAYA